MSEKLWAIYIPGPDEYYAAPSQSAAQHMAARHTAAMHDFVAKNNLLWGIELVTAEVAEWPCGADDHAQEMTEFDYSAWGLEGGAA